MAKILRTDGSEVAPAQAQQQLSFKEALAANLENIKQSSANTIAKFERLKVLCEKEEVQEAIELVMSLGIGQR